MININEHTDSTDGQEPARQLAIAITHLIIVCTIVALTHYLTRFTVMTSAILATLPIAIYLNRGLVNPGPNKIVATDNPLSRTQFEDGGTQYIIYQTGLSLKYAWERTSAEEINIENADPIGSRELTITIDDVALEVKIKGMWRVYLPNLSMFIQNVDELEVTLNQMKAMMSQVLEEHCAKEYSGQRADKQIGTERVRQNQSAIIDHVLKTVRPRYLKEGIDLIDLNFERCDYSQETQKELNKLIELRSIQKMADNIGSDPQAYENFRLVAAAAGKPGVTLKKDVREIIMTSETAESLKNISVGGAIAAGLMDETKEAKK